MVFEVKIKDLLGRIGKLKTKSGIIETPALLPVINPRKLDIKPKQFFEEFGYKALITNAYLLKKHFEREVLEKTVHGFLDYKGVIMTDSGAYQILRYGEIEVQPMEILEFQKRIKSDIGVILDIPTGWRASRKHAEWTVKETLNRAQQAVKYLQEKNERTLWVGPIQGGNHLDLVEFSAREMGKLPFDVYALGSPTEVMEQYFFDVLVEMIITAKRNLPADKPFHLFGAGHPFMFSFAVALGCDLFDSASYALYAKDDRYITETGTIRLENLRYFLCNCPVCRSLTPEELKEKEKGEREFLLMKHNLYACKVEIERIKQSIVEGRLWELLELRARSHPALLQAFKVLAKYSKLLAKETPVYKSRGIFIFEDTSLIRPEIITHKRRLLEYYEKPEKAEILLLLPQPDSKPFHKSSQYKKVEKILDELGKDGLNVEKIHVCFYSAPFGVIPLEVDDVYPLSQFEVAKPYTPTMVKEAAKTIVTYAKLKGYSKVLLHPNSSFLNKKVVLWLRRGIGDILIKTTRRKKTWSSKSLEDLKKTLKKVLES